jgi:hypothetical protein
VTKKGARSFTVAMSALSGRTRARWFDPTSGNYLAVSNGYAYPNVGRRAFTTPGRHADGTDDWVLVLDSTAKPRCGSISPSGKYTAPRTAPIGVTCDATASLQTDPSVTSHVRVTFTGRS